MRRNLRRSITTLAVSALATGGALAITATPAAAAGSQCTPLIFSVTNTTASPQLFTIFLATPDGGLVWETGDRITITSTTGPPATTATIKVNDVVVASTASLANPLVYTFPGDLVAPPPVSTQYDITIPAGGTVTGTCDHPTPWPTVPSGPFDVAATPGPASKQITLAWSPANPNGSAILFYTGQCVAAAANPGLPTKTATTGPGKTTLLMGGLVAGKKYSCTVQATNAVGSGPKVVTTPLVVTAKA